MWSSVPWLPAVVAVGAVAVAYGVVVERRWFRVVRRRLAILPATGPETLTILHLSDLHVVRGDRAKARFLASLPTADVTVVTGDFLAEPQAVERAVDLVRPTRGRVASWFVLGSNDYYVARPSNPLRYFVPHRLRRSRRAERGPSENLVRRLAADGWSDLTNTRTDVEIAGLPVELLGLDDAHIRRHDLRVAPRRSPDRFGVAVMHSPDSAPEAAACGYDLLLAGHTHGGQLAVPFLGPLVTNSAMPRRAASGLLRMGGSVLSLSPGLGTSKYAPIRFAVRPTALVLELTRRA